MPCNGTIHVRAGQKVNASDSIGSAIPEKKHHLINIRRSLGLKRSEQAVRFISRKNGDMVEKGDILAETTGLFSRVVRSPVNGKIIGILGSQILIEENNPPIEYKAGISGTVKEIIAERGVIIETSGALIQGVWGNNRVDSGMLINIAENPSEELTVSRLDISLRGAIIVAGHCSSAETLLMAKDLPLRGLILASMSADLIPLARQVEFPIILIEGFGRIPMNSAAFNLLKGCDKSDVCVNSEWTGNRNQKPEVVVPILDESELPREADDFAKGKTVKINGQPYPSQIGFLVRVMPGSTTMSNGIRISTGEIRLENNEQVFVPLTNLEILE